MMFRVLVLQTLYTLSDDQTEYQLRDRLSFMRFAGLALHDAVPDAKTIWLFREQLVRAGAFERLFARFDAALSERGYLAKGGQIVDATIVEARRPRLTQAEKGVVKGGGIPEGWKPARTRQIDREGRWTLKRGKKKPVPPGGSARAATEIAVPMFGYKNHVGIDREHGFVRRFKLTHAAAHDGAQLGAVLDPANTASPVWADTACPRVAASSRATRVLENDVSTTRASAWRVTKRGHTDECSSGVITSHLPADLRASRLNAIRFRSLNGLRTG
jgi:IS5 family transposase